MEKIIYARWLAVELRKRGCYILREEINENHPQFNCWVFRDDDFFRSAYEAIMCK